MTKWTTVIVVAVATAIYKDCRWNCQCSLHQEGSGRVPGNCQDKKAWIFVPGRVSVLGQLTKSTLPSLSKSPWHRKALRRSPTHPIHWISPQWPFFSFHEWSQSWLASRLSQDSFKMSRVGVMLTIAKDEFATHFDVVWVLL